MTRSAAYERALALLADIYRVVWTDARLSSEHVLALADTLDAAGYDAKEIRRASAVES